MRRWIPAMDLVETEDHHVLHGVLELRIPKPEQVKPRKVTISVGAGTEARDEIVEGTASPDGGTTPTPEATPAASA